MGGAVRQVQVVVGLAGSAVAGHGRSRNGPVWQAWRGSAWYGEVGMVRYGRRGVDSVWFCQIWLGKVRQARLLRLVKVRLGQAG